MANNDIDKSKRLFNQPAFNGGVGALSDKSPLPNIIRLEPLSASARSRYLGSLQKISNTFRGEFERNRDMSPFYGFMKNGFDKSITLTSNWANKTGSSSAMGIIGSLVGGGQINTSGSANGVGAVVSDIAGLTRDFTGISVSNTGVGSMQQYNGTTISGFSLECGWYLPAQYEICIYSLKRLLSMSYPASANGAGFGNALVSGVSAASSAVGSVGTDILNIVTGGGNKKSVDDQTKNESGSPPEGNAAIPLIDNTTLANGANKLSKIAELFGRNLTYDPLPVRCSVGSYMDIEPLVIKSVGIKFSKEMFVKKNAETDINGITLPVFCTVTIELAFWMTPAPNMEFMSLLNSEMFRESVGNTSNRKGNSQASQKEGNNTTANQPVKRTGASASY